MTKCTKEQEMISRYRIPATVLVRAKEPVKVDGPIPSEKIKLTCEKHGEFNPIYYPHHESIKAGIMGEPETSHTIEFVCGKCLIEKQEELYRTEQAEEKRKLEERLEASMLSTIEECGVSYRNRLTILDKVEPVNDKQKAAKAKLTQIVDAIQQKKQAQNLILSGSVGTGKTMLCSGAVVTLLRSGHKAAMTTVNKMIREFKSTWRKDSPNTEDEIIDWYIARDLLVIDEIGVQFGSDTEKLFLFEIIDGRYNKMKPTILISNLAVAGIRDLIGERCLNRLKEDGGSVVAFDFESQRGIK